MSDSCTKPDAAAVRLTSLAHGGGCGCKISPKVLSEILKKVPAGLPAPPELLVGIESSDDAAVYKLNDEQCVVATTDFFMPIVDDPFDFGRIAATNAISDVYAMGAKPIFALAIVAMPASKLPLETISKILAGGQSTCTEAGILIAGGHTIDSVEPIYGLIAIGVVHPKHLKKNCDARPGDVLVLGKALGVGIMGAALKKEKLEPAQYKTMIDSTCLLNSAGPELAKIEGVHAITDVTGFALAGHTLEMARACGATAKIGWGTVPLLAGVRELADAGFKTGASTRNWESYGHEVTLPPGFSEADTALLTDPQTSGGLLVSCAPDAVDKVLEAFRTNGCLQATPVGSFEAGEPRLVVVP